jgi:hypothetical protein
VARRFKVQAQFDSVHETQRFPFLRAPQAHLDPQHVSQHGFHQPSRQSTDHRPIGDQRRQLRPKVSRDLLRQRRAHGLAAAAADYIGKLLCAGASSEA